MVLAAAPARQRRLCQMVAVSNAVVVMAAMLAPAALPVAVGLETLPAAPALRHPPLSPPPQPPPQPPAALSPARRPPPPPAPQIGV